MQFRANNYYEVLDDSLDIVDYKYYVSHNIFWCEPVYVNDINEKPTFFNRLISRIKMLYAHGRETWNNLRHFYTV